PFKGKTGLRRVWNALHYSMDGLRAAYVGEDAFRQEVLLAAILIPLAFVLPVSWGGRAAMVASVLLVLIVELINSAIEAVVAIVHINTELRVAYKQALIESLQENPEEIAPYKYLKGPIIAVKQVVEKRLNLFSRR
ncbi:MAG TPA: diacylglycerol kinase, partial [Candidatus Paceibacterota bacterium]|nr:diacylglycerol kinase [Candidatus Paceibacterota bacterium]